jgi:hypothetical protein
MYQTLPNLDKHLSDGGPAVAPEGNSRPGAGFPAAGSAPAGGQNTSVAMPRSFSSESVSSVFAPLPRRV